MKRAVALGVVGLVKNMSDGTVEVRASGDTEQLASLYECLRKGSLLSRVDNVDEVSKQHDVEGYNSFDII